MLTGRTRSQHGFTVVELLVVIVIMGIVGAIVTSGVVSSMRSTTSTQARIEAMAELQRGAERIARELRAACPVEGPDPLVDDEVQVLVLRDGTTQRHRFALTAGVVEHEAWSYDDATDGWVVAFPARPLVNDVVDDPDAPMLRYVDGDRQPTVEPREVRSIRLTLTRDLDGQPPLQVETAVQLRNGGRACD